MEYKLILASASPRRHQLMCDAGFKFEVRLKHTEEIWPEGLAVEEVPEYLAGLKAKAFDGELKEGELLITADTVVCLDAKILGKPENREHAIEMLHRLSGRKHQVVTGVCLTTLQEHRSFSAYTYGIQEWIGYIGIERIEGSFYNVMGLPVQQLYEALRRFPKKS